MELRHPRVRADRRGGGRPQERGAQPGESLQRRFLEEGRQKGVFSILHCLVSACTGRAWVVSEQMQMLMNEALKVKDIRLLSSNPQLVYGTR